jgi:tagatose 6-phosphate kinase
MFLTVTFNPALDKTLLVDRNPPQATIRASRVIALAGGKGVNVARAVHALGGRARALMPLAGHAGAHLADLARQEGLEIRAVPVRGETRLALTVQDAETGQYWHYLEPGPQLDEHHLDRFRNEFLDALEGCHTVALSGSLPSASVGGLVPWMVTEAKARGLRVALDSFGAHGLAALHAGPWLAKPNREEWKATTGQELTTLAECRAALEQMRQWGISIAVLSHGAEGALALTGGGLSRILPVPVTEVNDLGGGDSMVAGICWAAAQGYTETECLAWGAACGAANAAVWDPAGIEKSEVERLLTLVQVERVD